MNSLLQEAKQYWIKEDYGYRDYLNRQLGEFGRLYLKHFDKPLYREINTMVINDLKNEMEAVNARLCANQAGRRSIHYCLAGDTAKAGQTGN